MAVIKDNNEVEYVDNEDITQEPIQVVEEQPKTKKS